MIIKYKTGYDFYQDNQLILDQYPIDTSFFKLNYKMISSFSKTSYAFKVIEYDLYLLLLRLDPYPTLVFGNPSLSKIATEFIIENHLKMNNVLCSKKIYETLFSELIHKIGGHIEIMHSMDLMYMNKASSIMEIQSFNIVKKATESDIDRILQLNQSFSEEVNVDTSLSNEDRYKEIKNEIQNYYYIEENDKIVSIAKKVREDEKICAISYVYTLSNYRNHGYAKKIVNKITKDILNSQKIAYLYVDKTNPISNHLYQSIGYTYGNAKYEIRFEENR